MRIRNLNIAPTRDFMGFLTGERADFSLFFAVLKAVEFRLGLSRSPGRFDPNPEVGGSKDAEKTLQFGVTFLREHLL